MKARKVFRAIAKHEFYHAQHNHSLQKSIATAILPCVTTAAVTACVAKLFPFNSNASLLRHCGQFGAKVVGGTLLAALNIAIGLYAEKIISHQQEYAADQNVALEDRPDLILHLQNGHKKRQESIDAMQHATNKALAVGIDQLGHPPVEERIERLQQNGTKKA